MLLKMVDGGIVDFTDEIEGESNYCDTCDFGKSYIVNLEIELTRSTILIISEGYLSQSDIMKIILPNVNDITKMKESEFLDWMKEQLTKIKNCKFNYIITEKNIRFKEN